MKHTYKVAKRYHIETIPQAPIITLIATISKSHYVIVEIGLMKKYLDYNVCMNFYNPNILYSYSFQDEYGNNLKIKTINNKNIILKNE